MRSSAFAPLLTGCWAAINGSYVGASHRHGGEFEARVGGENAHMGLRVTGMDNAGTTVVGGQLLFGAAAPFLGDIDTYRQAVDIGIDLGVGAGGTGNGPYAAASASLWAHVRIYERFALRLAVEETVATDDAATGLTFLVGLSITGKNALFSDHYR